MKPHYSGVAAVICLTITGSTLAETSLTEPTVSINFAGDIMIADSVGKAIKRGRDPFAPFATILYDSPQTAHVRTSNIYVYFRRLLP